MTQKTVPLQEESGNSAKTSQSHTSVDIAGSTGECKRDGRHGRDASASAHRVARAAGAGAAGRLAGNGNDGASRNNGGAIGLGGSDVDSDGRGSASLSRRLEGRLDDGRRWSGGRLDVGHAGRDRRLANRGVSNRGIHDRPARGLGHALVADRRGSVASHRAHRRGDWDDLGDLSWSVLGRAIGDGLRAARDGDDSRGVDCAGGHRHGAVLSKGSAREESSGGDEGLHCC